MLRVMTLSLTSSKICSGYVNVVTVILVFLLYVCSDCGNDRLILNLLPTTEKGKSYWDKVSTNEKSKLLALILVLRNDRAVKMQIRTYQDQDIECA